MLVIHTAADIIRILADAHGSQSIDLIEKHLIEKQAVRHLATIRTVAQQVVCSAKDMEQADGERMLRLPNFLNLSPEAQKLKDTFYNLMVCQRLNIYKGPMLTISIARPYIGLGWEEGLQ